MGMGCVKITLFVFNLIFVIFGIILVYSGINTEIELNDYGMFLKDSPSTSAIVLTVIGIIVFVIAFLGCCGAIKENFCMLCTFGGIILVFLIVELIGAGLVLAYRKEVKTVVGDALVNVIQKYEFNNTDADFSKIMDDLQIHLKCCGSKNKLDWHNTEAITVPLPSEKYPWSCCEEPEDVEINDNVIKLCSDQSKPQIYHNGCLNVLDDQIRHSYGLLGGIAIAIAVIQLILVILSYCLGCVVNSNKKVMV